MEKYKNKIIILWIVFFAYAIGSAVCINLVLRTEQRDYLPIVYIFAIFYIVTIILLPVMIFCLQAMAKELLKPKKA